MSKDIKESTMSDKNCKRPELCLETQSDNFCNICPNSPVNDSRPASCPLALVEEEWIAAKDEYETCMRRYREALTNHERVDWILDEASYARGQRDALSAVLKSTPKD